MQKKFNTVLVGPIKMCKRFKER